MGGEPNAERRRVYLDVCCLNRPFDDRSQGRVRLESEAVLLILSMLLEEPWERLGSEVVDFEISRIPDPERLQRVEMLAARPDLQITLDAAIIERGEQLSGLGFKSYDALHLSCAEAGEAEVFLTTDDRLLRLAKKVSREMRIQVENPLSWLREVNR